MKRFLFTIVMGGALFAAGGIYADEKLTEVYNDDPALAKMTSDLVQIRKEIQSGAGPGVSIRSLAPQSVRDDQLQVIIGVTEITEDLLDACRLAGLEIVGTYRLPYVNHVVVRCSDPRHLESIARRADVRGIATEPTAVKSTGSVTSQADRSIHADVARSTYSVDGTGVRVGVMSDSANVQIKGTIQDGFLTGSNSQNTQDLPESVRIVDGGNGEGNDEGAAMMEIVHDLAPGADLSFAAVEYSYSNYAQNISSLVSDSGYEVDVLVDDIFFLQEPIYQDGPVAIAAKNAVQAGIPYFSAASNFADNGHERPFTDNNSNQSDSGTYPPPGNDLHDFGVSYGGDTDTHLSFDLGFYDGITVALHWDEPYNGVLGAGPGAESDLDIYIVSDETLPLTDGADGNILASSVNVQGVVGAPAGEPYEMVSFTNEDFDTVTVHVVINHAKGRTPETLHLFVEYFGYSGYGDFTDKAYVMDRTLMGHSTAEGVIAVAAINFQEIDSNGQFNAPTDRLNVDSYSALGGNVAKYISDDGNTRFLNPVMINKPDLTGPTGADTSFFGTDTNNDGHPNFSGTSAAAPHVAAVAALMRQANPSLTPAQISQILTSTAIDINEPGYDFHSGFGLVDAEKAVEAALQTTIVDWQIWE